MLRERDRKERENKESDEGGEWKTKFGRRPRREGGSRVCGGVGQLSSSYPHQNLAAVQKHTQECVSVCLRQNESQRGDWNLFTLQRFQIHVHLKTSFYSNVGMKTFRCLQGIKEKVREESWWATKSDLNISGRSHGTKLTSHTHTHTLSLQCVLPPAGPCRRSGGAQWNLSGERLPWEVVVVVGGRRGVGAQIEARCCRRRNEHTGPGSIYRPGSPLCTETHW